MCRLVKTTHTFSQTSFVYEKVRNESLKAEFLSFSANSNFIPNLSPFCCVVTLGLDHGWI